MGKGKGSFDYWAARVAVSQIVFEVKGECHEQVVRDAMRLAGNKLPGEFDYFTMSWGLSLGLSGFPFEVVNVADVRHPYLQACTNSSRRVIPQSWASRR